MPKAGAALLKKGNKKDRTYENRRETLPFQMARSQGSGDGRGDRMGSRIGKKHSNQIDPDSH